MPLRALGQQPVDVLPVDDVHLHRERERQRRDREEQALDAQRGEPDERPRRSRRRARRRASAHEEVGVRGALTCPPATAAPIAGEAPLAEADLAGPAGEDHQRHADDGVDRPRCLPGSGAADRTTERAERRADEHQRADQRRGPIALRAGAAAQAAPAGTPGSASTSRRRCRGPGWPAAAEAAEAARSTGSASAERDRRVAREVEDRLVDDTERDRRPRARR